MPPTTKGDEPRLIVVCNPAEFPEIHRGVMAMGHGDVLVKSDRYVPEGQSFVMKPPGTFVGRFTPWKDADG